MDTSARRPRIASVAAASAAMLTLLVGLAFASASALGAAPVQGRCQPAGVADDRPVGAGDHEVVWYV